MINKRAIDTSTGGDFCALVTLGNKQGIAAAIADPRWENLNTEEKYEAEFRVEMLLRLKRSLATFNAASSVAVPASSDAPS